jgi:hypothetical protein
MPGAGRTGRGALVALTGAVSANGGKNGGQATVLVSENFVLKSHPEALRSLAHENSVRKNVTIRKPLPAIAAHRAGLRAC